MPIRRPGLRPTFARRSLEKEPPQRSRGRWGGDPSREMMDPTSTQQHNQKSARRADLGQSAQVWSVSECSGEESVRGMDGASGSFSIAVTAAKPITANPRQLHNPYRTQSNACFIDSSPHRSPLRRLRIDPATSRSRYPNTSNSLAVAMNIAQRQRTARLICQ